MKSQEDVEREMNARAEARARRKHESRITNSRLSTTPAGVALIRRAVEPIVEVLETVIKTRGKAGYRAGDVQLLEGLDLYMCAYIALQECIDGAFKRQPLVSVAISIGRAIEAELDAQAFEKENPTTYARTVMRAKIGKESANKLRNRIRKGARVHEVALRWTPPIVVRLGTRLVDAVIEATGLIESELVVLYGNTKRRQHKLKLSDSMSDWIRDYNADPVLVQPLYLPMVEPPKDWTALYDGGYYHTPSGGKPVSFVAGMTIAHKKVLEEADLSAVYSVVNTIQKTPWQVNSKVYEVMQYAWDNIPDHPAIPSREDRELPVWTEEMANEAPGGPTRKVWRTEARKVHEYNAQIRGHRFDYARNIHLAKEYQGADKLYYVHHTDFRGRIYPLANALSPQGPDHARGLIRFAFAKALGESGWYWFRVHGSNLFGNDKCSFEDRVRWVEEHSSEILESASSPHSNLWWTEADKPWQFLAWCFEYSEAHLDPLNYKSSIPVQMDGSCNGLQHYAALLRDVEAGEAVNLVPHEKPADIYQVVADRVVDKLKEMVSKEEKHWDHAAGWLQFGIDRKITKRSVMTVPYAVTFRSSMRYVRTAVREKIDAGTPNPFGPETIAPATVTLGRIVWDAIQEVVSSAAVGMKYLQDVAKESNAKKQPISWVSPIGFPCYQGYRNFKHRRIKTKFRGNVVIFSLHEELLTLDTRKQINAIAPNFVHSMDASHLMFTIMAMEKYKPGEFAYSMVHDSYGCHAADVDTMGAFLRSSFVTMYSSTDWFKYFQEEVLGEVTVPVPDKGDLDLNLVLEAPYFFG